APASRAMAAVSSVEPPSRTTSSSTRSGISAPAIERQMRPTVAPSSTAGRATLIETPCARFCSTRLSGRSSAWNVCFAYQRCARSRTLCFMDTIAWSQLERLVARVTGDDPAAFLDATTTQDLTGLTAGRSVLTCMLDEKGHVQAELRATMLDDGAVLIDAEQAARDAITGWLAKIAPLSGCEVTDESDLWTVTALFGVHDAPAGAVALASDWGPSDLDVLHEVATAFEGAEMSAGEYETARIAAGRP